MVIGILRNESSGTIKSKSALNLGITKEMLFDYLSSHAAIRNARSAFQLALMKDMLFLGNLMTVMMS